MEDDVKEAGNVILGESADVEEVIGVELEKNKLSVVAWEYCLAVFIGSFIKIN